MRNSLSQREAEVNSLIDRTLGENYGNILEVQQALPTIRKLLDLLLSGAYPTNPTTPVTDTSFTVMGTNVKYFGVKGDGTAIDTVALKAAFVSAVTNKHGLYFPDGTYLIDDEIPIGSADVEALTGLTVTGQSQLNTIIKQTKANTRCFKFIGKYIHTIRWTRMNFTYADMQKGNTDAAVFYADGGDSFYMSTFEEITGSNFYFFFDCPEMLWWGNCYRDFWLGDFAGGVNRVTGTAGEPNCRFERMYITCESAVECLFEHQAMAAQYDSIEVNAAFSGATMIKDTSGGTHVIGHFALEGAHYTTGKTLFEMQNSVLMADFIYTESISCPAGVDLYVFHSEGPKSNIYVRLFSITGIGNQVHGGLDGTINASLAIGPHPIRFKQVNMPFAGNVRLTDILASPSADITIVEDWADTSRVALNDDADVTLAYDSEYNQVWAASTGRTAKLPQSGPQDTTNLFRGRGFRIVKSAIVGALSVTTSDGQLLATLPGGARGVAEFIWSRAGGDGFSWLLVDQRSF
ncbi:glycoside hydrolase family 55 protein [Caballeronia sp. TF1N1]|uniref:glycoside hydrolase family 55 protein n=1 Tax=Caballeronia sp. TF1N1 TaxID=2878153 RepID=UPI001FD571F4|nr:glycoside hydrolase family 55 protein [Caballeronia sp. TF1N1]